MIRVTVSLSFRSGAEVLLHDSTAPSLLSARHALAEALDRVIENGGGELGRAGQIVMRLAHRDFQLMDADRPLPRRRVELPPGEF